MTELQSHYFSCRGERPLIDAVKKAYEDMPDEFSGMKLFNTTIRYYRRPNVYIDSVLRRMRELRDMGIIDYLCVNGIDSKYKKK